MYIGERGARNASARKSFSPCIVWAASAAKWQRNANAHSRSERRECCATEARFKLRKLELAISRINNTRANSRRIVEKIFSFPPPGRQRAAGGGRRERHPVGVFFALANNNGKKGKYRLHQCKQQTVDTIAVYRFAFVSLRFSLAALAPLCEHNGCAAACARQHSVLLHSHKGLCSIDASISAESRTRSLGCFSHYTSNKQTINSFECKQQSGEVEN